MRKPTDPTDKHVGSRVRMRRLMLGVSQTKLADALEKPPAEAKRLLAAYVKAQTEIKTAKEALQRLGFGIDHGYANNYAYDLEIDYSTKPQAIRDYDAETARVEKSLAELKRSYTLKLFAGGEELKPSSPRSPVSLLPL